MGTKKDPESRGIGCIDLFDFDPKNRKAGVGILIADRADRKRFAKIAGEMVSLSAVEVLSAELWPQLITVVVSLPDARKGERLALLTTDANCTREQFSQFAKRKGATELMVPADILVVDKIPLLGSGKPDYVAALNVAKERVASRSAA